MTQDAQAGARLRADRRLARQIVRAQLIVTLLLGLAWWLGKGSRDAAAALLAGLAVAAGTALLAWRMFGSVAALGTAWVRLAVGTLLKWGVMLVVLVVALGRCRLPPGAALTGLIGAYAVNWWAFRMRVS